MKKAIVFDCESAGCSEQEAQQFMPEFEAPSNYKDETKIAAAIAEKKKVWLAETALNPLTARVMVIGLMVSDTFVLIGPPASESEILYEFWDAIQDVNDIHKIIGFNICNFDLPLLCRSSYRLGVPIPKSLRDGRYWSRQVVDLRDLWTLGDRQAPGSLDTIAKYLNVGAKTGSGKDFAALWASDREKAIEYLKNDLSLTSAIARKLGVL